MQFIQNLPIKRKMTLVILLTCGVVLLIACAALFVFQAVTVRRNFTRDLSTLASIIAHNSTAAVAFGDKKATEEILSALQAKPQVVSASIRLPDGAWFARFGAGDDRKQIDRFPMDQGLRYDGEHVLLAEPIAVDGSRLGTLYLRAEFRSTYVSLVSL